MSGTVNTTGNVGGNNAIDPTPKPSSNEWLGIDSVVAAGTFGSRETTAEALYGGDQKGRKGIMSKGVSAPSPNAETNSGGVESASRPTGQYGRGDFQKGGYGARENMPKYGGSDASSLKGVLVGKGAGAIPSTNPRDQLVGSAKTQPGQDVVLGTSRAVDNMSKSKKGLSNAGGKPSRND